MARRSKKLHLLFVADPLDRFDPVAETTLHMMREAQNRGHKIYATTPQELNARNTEVFCHATTLQIFPPGKTPWYRRQKTESRALKDFDALLLRKDPPFDREYLHHLYLLEMASGQVYMMNDPRGILMANEKLLPLLFPDRCPDTLISCHPEELSQFIHQHPNGTILKPLGEAGGRGVYYLKGPQAENLKVILENLTEGFRRHIIAQSYLKEARRGDRRILLLGGKFLGAFTRKPAQGEHRANLHAGGQAAPAQLGPKDHALIDRLTPVLNSLGLDFVGLDLIGESLIEVNLTSPMGLHEAQSVQGGHPTRAVLDFIESKIT